MYQLTTDQNTVINLTDGSYVDVSNGDYQAWLADGNTPEPIALADAQQYKYGIIVSAADTAKAAGITSNALGSTYTYSGEDSDMVHYNSVVAASMLPQLQGQTTMPMLVQNSSGVWAYLQHGIPQIQQAGADLFTGVNAILTKKQDLINQIMSATDSATVMAISW
jgi:hypothetical protein